MRIAVIGANGQVGSDIVSAARGAGIEVDRVTHAECDVVDKSTVAARLAGLEPGDAVVDTAAFHRTDECEAKPELAFSVNAVGAQHVADVARDRGASVVYVSSDFVFDGGKRTPYVESDAPRPINTYGVSKLAGEMLTLQSNPHAYVARISSVFGVAGSSGKGGNFVESILAKARAGDTLTVVDDIVMAPTSAADAASLLVALIARRAPSGVYHLANAGACSWNEFANAVLELAGSTFRAAPVHTRLAPGAARRPAYSVLASERLGALGLHARPWRDALEEYLRAKGHAVGRP
jgi:dTDP-4-dehydrorhamnose reductase